MKRKTLLLATLACAMTLGAGIAPAWSYFTDSSTANGGIPIGVQPSTDITEWVGEGVKHVTISNAADATSSVFVRARVYSSLDVQVAGTGWSGPADDGWYAYATPVAPGEQAEELAVSVSFPAVQSDEQPTGAAFGDNYNVVVVYESTPVQYDAQGQPFADWSYVLDSGN